MVAFEPVTLVHRAWGSGQGRLALALTAALTTAACGEPDAPLRVVAEEEHLSREVEDLRRLVGRAEKGTLVPRDAVVIVLSERLVREAVRLSLPREEALPGGFRVRLERVDVRLRDGQAAARLHGGVAWADDHRVHEGDVSAQLTLFARVEATTPDARARTLTARVVPYGFEIHHLRVGEERPRTRRLIEALGRALPEAFPALSTSIALPIAVERGVRLSGVKAGPIEIDGATVPVTLSVRDTFAQGGRLFVVLHVMTGRWKRESR